MARDRYSPHFTIAELVTSQTARQRGIDNSPTPEHREALALLCGLVLEPVRHLAGGPLEVTSGYRSAALNRAISGARLSQHVKGQAADVKAQGMPSRQLAARLWRVRHHLPIGQAIWYDPERGGHLHVSIDLDRLRTGEAPRRQFMHAPASGGYVPWEP